MYTKIWTSCFLLLAAAISSEALSEEMQEVAKMLHDNCQQQTQIPEEMITNTMKGEFPDDERLKCYFKCLMTEMASMDENGVVDIDATIAMLPDELQNTAIPDTLRKCGNMKGGNACETAYLMHKCVYENNPKDYFVI